MKLNEWWYQVNPLMGVDIGSRTIKGVRLKSDSKGRLKLVSHFFQDLAQTTEDFPSQDNLEESIKAAVEINRLKSTHSASGVKDSEVITFSFELPKMNEKELIETVPLEMVDHATVPLDDYVFDFTARQQDEKNEVKIYCIKKDLILERMGLLKKAGFKPRSIEPEMMALTAMLEYNEYLNAEEVVGVLDFGESSVSSGLIVNRELVLTRSENLSFGQVNQMIREQTGCSYEDAEILMSNYDFLASQEHQEGTNKLLDEGFTAVFKVIKEMIEFYQECHESLGKIDRLFLVGGGTQYKNIELIHETFFKIPAKIVNPFRNIEIMMDKNPELNEEMVKVSPFMGVAVGLALPAPLRSQKDFLKKGEQDEEKE